MAATNRLDLKGDPRAIIGMRVFDAPREMVCSTFTDPKHLAQWWGSKGFTNPVCEFDARMAAGFGFTCARRTALFIR